jgi:antitoxin MazE
MEEEQNTNHSVTSSRKDWERAFEMMAKSGDDDLLIDDFFVDENLDE